MASLQNLWATDLSVRRQSLDLINWESGATTIGESVMLHLEVCVDRIEHAMLAASAGATRIEYNQALAEDGLTPSLSSCRWLAKHCPVPVVAMLRPHNAGFVYSQPEQEIMLEDCRRMLDTGIAGIAVGALTEAAELDRRFLESLLTSVSGRGEMVLHRAFDAVTDQDAALQHAIELRFHRILTSGGGTTATAGLQQLSHLQLLSAGRIEILPGAGINAVNALRIIETAGVNQLHGSFRGSDPAAGPDQEQIRLVLQAMRSKLA